MHIWTYTFAGHWPIGACGIVISSSHRGAIRMVKKALANELLLDENIDDKGNLKFKLKEIDPMKSQAIILLDGEY